MDQLRGPQNPVAVIDRPTPKGSTAPAPTSAPEAAPSPAEAWTPPPPRTGDEVLAAVHDADKRFGDVQALHHLNIEIPRSRITVLLGPNGAGKTTAIRLITGALRPDRGEVTVFGEDPSGPAGEDIRRRCGVVSAKPSLYDRLNGLDNLRYAAELYDLGRSDAVDRRIREAADQFGIEHALDQPVGGYSTGMKTRLALARSILHQPDLLLLDEPTSGLDPESAMAVLGMVRDMTAEGRTVLMCTHLLLEAEGLADEVAVIQDGTTLVWGEPAELSRRYWPVPEVTLTTRQKLDAGALAELPGVEHVEVDGPDARFRLDREDRTAEIVGVLAGVGVLIDAVVPYRPTLEDLYFSVRREYLIEQDNESGEAGNRVWDRIRSARPAAGVDRGEDDS